MKKRALTIFLLGNKIKIERMWYKMSEIDELLQESMQDEEFRKEWEASETEYQITRMLLAARAEKHMTQKQLAEDSGVRQSNISRIENGTCTPNIATLEALAEGLGKRLKIELV